MTDRELCTWNTSRRCDADERTRITHRVGLPPMCPVSGNPREGVVCLSYSPREGVVVDVDDLAAEVASFVGGRGDVRDMERVIQRLAEWGAEVTGAEVVAEADLVISTRPESESRLLIRCERG